MRTPAVFTFTSTFECRAIIRPRHLHYGSCVSDGRCAPAAVVFEGGKAGDNCFSQPRRDDSVGGVGGRRANFYYPWCHGADEKRHTVINEGASASGRLGAPTAFLMSKDPSAGNATPIANNGSNGGGGGRASACGTGRSVERPWLEAVWERLPRPQRPQRRHLSASVRSRGTAKSISVPPKSVQSEVTG